MLLKINVETGDLGQREGYVFTTLHRPNEINILMDPSRSGLKDDVIGDWMRRVIARELDIGLACLTDPRYEPEQLRALMEKIGTQVFEPGKRTVQ